MTFRQLNIVPVLMLAALIALKSYYPAIEWWGYGVIILFQLGIIVYGCINISSNYFLHVLCKAATTEKVVALSFDDGPHPVHTPAILDTLKKYNVPATFFCIGRHIEGNVPLLRRMYNEGHLVGNHSFTHDFWFDMHRSKKMLADMRQADEAVKQSIGFRPLMFRPPYGVTNPNLARAIKRGRYIPIGWSIRSLDTATNDKQKLLSRITGQLTPGGVILLHDTMEITAAILPELIETIKEKGYTIKSLDEMLNISAYA